MKQDFYNYEVGNDGLYFSFTSVSEHKIIPKIIVYTPFPNDPNFFNLALGDILENGEISDLTVSNNSDMEKVIATVIRTMFNFLKITQTNLFISKGVPQKGQDYIELSLQKN